MRQNSIIRSFLLSITLVMLCTTTYALDIRIISTDTGVMLNTPSQQPYEILDQIIAPNFIRAYISYNNMTGDFYLPISARKRAKVRIEWGHPNDVFLANRNKDNLINIENAGDEVGLRFRVLKPLTGNIKIYNEQNKLLKVIPYEIRKERKYRQSLRATVNNNYYKNNTPNYLTSDSNNTNQYYTVGYSITEKVNNGGDPYWSFDSNISTSTGNSASQSVSTTFSYNW